MMKAPERPAERMMLMSLCYLMFTLLSLSLKGRQLLPQEKEGRLHPLQSQAASFIAILSFLSFLMCTLSLSLRLII